MNNDVSVSTSIVFQHSKGGRMGFADGVDVNGVL